MKTRWQTAKWRLVFHNRARIGSPHERTADSLSFGGIGAAALACQWLAWRLKLPAILFLLLSGILAGLCWAGCSRRRCSARC
jgi:hypothetical protein